MPTKNKALWTRYRIETKEHLLMSCSNKCLICGVSLLKESFVDHSHLTNIVRGVICRRCNRWLEEPVDNLVTRKPFLVSLELDKRLTDKMLGYLELCVDWRKLR